MLVIANNIVIPMPPGQAFEIPLDECDSVDKILAWVIHLLDKDWVTKEIIKDFIDTAINQHKLPGPSV